MKARAFNMVAFIFCYYVTVNGIPRIRQNDYYVDGIHNVDYDRQLFLNKDEQKEFQQLTPAKRRRRLSEIVDKIDIDGNNNITKEELTSWIEYIQLKHLRDEVNNRWTQIDIDGDDLITWDEFKLRNYGHTMDHDNRDVDDNYRRKREINKKKWHAADLSNDNMLTREEYSAYLHPGEYRRMHHVAAEEILKRIDKDDDGYVSLEEYIAKYEEPKPAWVEAEKEIFLRERDKDGDGKLNKAEVITWLFPVNYNALDSEVTHLLHEADVNKDESLTKQEILAREDLFVGSKATNFGETLNRPLDEL